MVEKILFFKTEIELNMENFPSKYPVFLFFTEEKRTRFKAKMIRAKTEGIPTKNSIIFFSRSGSGHGFSLDDILKMVDDEQVLEISSREYQLLKDIPHWDLFKSAELLLQNFIDTITSLETPDSKELEQIHSLMQRAEGYERDLREGYFKG